MTRRLALHLTVAWLCSGMLAAVLAFITDAGYEGAIFYGLLIGPVAGLIAFHRAERL